VQPRESDASHAIIGPACHESATALARRPSSSNQRISTARLQVARGADAGSRAARAAEAHCKRSPIRGGRSGTVSYMRSYHWP